MADEHEQTPAQPIPGMTTRRMGKRWRIIYTETRNLAVFNNGKPVDGGGFLDEFDEDNKKTVDGQLAAQRAQAMAEQAARDAGGQSMDPEAEGIGN